MLIDEIIPSSPHIQDIELSNVVSEDMRDDFSAALAANKPKKGKAGKKKKK